MAEITEEVVDVTVVRHSHTGAGPTDIEDSILRREARRAMVWPEREAARHSPVYT